MDSSNLVKMANDIGNFFKAEPDKELAINGVAEHIKRFWDPRMKRAIIAHLKHGGDGMAELPRLAVGKLAEEYHSLSQQGDG